MSQKYTYPEVPLEYVVAATFAQENKLNKRFLNDSAAYAKLLADLMIGRATEAAKGVIFSGGLSSDCFLDALTDTKAEKVRVVVQDKALLEKNLKSLSKDTFNKLEIRIQSGDQAEKFSNHFFVFGDSFRYELDNDKATAVANFNSEISTHSLLALFDEIWGVATPFTASSE